MATKRHGPEERRQWAARWHASELSGPEFARRHGLQVESVYRWGREFPEAAGHESSGPQTFTEVRVREGISAGSGSLEIVLGNGRVIRTFGSIDIEQLRAVVEVLEP